MSNAKHICPLINILINTYKSKEAKQPLPDSSCDEINPSAYTCGRLFACAMQKVAFVVSILFLLGACQKATLISSEESEENTRGSKEASDSTNVDFDFEAEDWEGAIDAEFTFGVSRKEI